MPYSATYAKRSHSYETVWKKTVAGFTTHQFNDDYTMLTNEFVTYEGKTIRTVVVPKDGERVAVA